MYRLFKFLGTFSWNLHTRGIGFFAIFPGLFTRPIASQMISITDYGSVNYSLLCGNDEKYIYQKFWLDEELLKNFKIHGSRTLGST